MARSLGRSPLRAFVMVTLPIARPALVAGVALAMMEALADFGTVATFGYRTHRGYLSGVVRYVWPLRTQLASGLLCFALGLLLIERTSRGRARFEIYRCGAGVTPTVLRGWRATLAIGACLAVLGPGFSCPSDNWPCGPSKPSRPASSRQPLVHLLNTLYLAGLATGLACLMAVVLRLRQSAAPHRVCGGRLNVPRWGMPSPAPSLLWGSCCHWHGSIIPSSLRCWIGS